MPGDVATRARQRHQAWVHAAGTTARTEKQITKMSKSYTKLLSLFSLALYIKKSSVGFVSIKQAARLLYATECNRERDYFGCQVDEVGVDNIARYRVIK